MMGTLAAYILIAWLALIVLRFFGGLIADWLHARRGDSWTPESQFELAKWQFLGSPAVQAQERLNARLDTLKKIGVCLLWPALGLAMAKWGAFALVEGLIITFIAFLIIVCLANAIMSKGGD